MVNNFPYRLHEQYLYQGSTIKLIIWLVLITCLHDNIVESQGELTWWSLWDLSSLVSQQLLCSLSINQWFYERPNRTYTINKSVKFFSHVSLYSWMEKRLHCKWSIAFGQCLWHFTFALILKGREKHLTPAVSS